MYNPHSPKARVRARKRDYARAKHLEDLLQPSKHPPPEWMNNPELLPKKPPKKEGV